MELTDVGRDRTFRGLALVFVLSFLNLLGILLTITALGGLGEWGRWQFVGLFGLLEAGAGIASVWLPNIWRLPVAEVQTSERTPVRLALSTLILPHWGGAARFFAGGLLMAVAATQEGVGLRTLLMPLVVLMVSVNVAGLSAAVARAGVQWPDVDVVQFVIRWRKKEDELPPISLTASVLQFLLGVITIPAIKLLAPGSLFQPELGPSAAGLAALAIATAIICASVVVLWRGRIHLRARREQQQEAEQNA